MNTNTNNKNDNDRKKNNNKDDDKELNSSTTTKDLMSTTTTQTEILCNKNEALQPTHTTVAAAATSHMLEEDRQKVVYNIYLPLLQSLSYYFIMIDLLQDEMELKEKKQTKELKKEGANKPKPPSGLISISQYTDIASIIELTVCTSILPLLEKGVSLSGKERYKHKLSSTLKGRIRPKALEWGCQVAIDNANDAATNASNNAKNRKAVLNQRIKKATDELKSTLIVLYNILILSDRFRPMLLPKHVDDIYAGLLQAERLDLLNLKLLKISDNDNNNDAHDNGGYDENNHDDDNGYYKNIKEEYKKVYIHFLPPILNGLIRSNDGRNDDGNNNNNGNNDDNHYGTNNKDYPPPPTSIDHRTIALTLRDILRSGPSRANNNINSTNGDGTGDYGNSTGCSCPLWLTKRAGHLLHNLASSDLASVIDVFVPTSSSNNTDSGNSNVDITGAAYRLGLALCSVPWTTEIVSENTNRQYYYCLLCQLIPVLDQSILRSNNTTVDKSGINAIVLTIWSTLENLPGVFRNRNGKDDDDDNWNGYGDNVDGNEDNLMCEKEGSILMSKMIRQTFSQMLVNGLIIPSSSTNKKDNKINNDNNNTTRVAIRRITYLISLAPPNSITAFGNSMTRQTKGLELSLDGVNLVGDALCRTQDLSEMTAMAALLRIATSTTKAEKKKAVTLLYQEGSLRVDAILALRTIISAIMMSSPLSSSFQRKSLSPSVAAERCCPHPTVEKIVAVTLLECVALNKNDEMGYRFNNSTECWDNKEREEEDEIEKRITLIHDVEERARFVVEELLLPPARDFASRIDNTSKQSRGAQQMTSTTDSSSSTTATRLCLLPSTMFRLLLLIYFHSQESSSSSISSLPSLSSSQLSYLPESINSRIDEYKLVSMFVLPHLCERCPPVSLLLEEDGSISATKDENVAREEMPVVPESSGILQIVNMIIYCAAKLVRLEDNNDYAKYDKESNYNDSSGSHISRKGIDDDSERPRLNSRLCDFRSCSLMTTKTQGKVKETNRLDYQSSTTDKSSDKSDCDEDARVLTFSVTSIILGVLVAMLELGSLKRSKEEEVEMRQMMPSLYTLAIPGESIRKKANPLSSVPVNEYDNDNREILAKISDMASHAMALISSRSAEPCSVDIEDNDKKNCSGEENVSFSSASAINLMIKRLGSDLSSDLPPLRARVMVELRRIVRGRLADLFESNTRVMTSSPFHANIPNDHQRLVTVLDTDEENVVVDEEALGGLTAIEIRLGLIERVLEVSLMSLADIESYVYLAAIQTIVAVADLCPSHVIPILGSALVTGVVKLINVEKGSVATTKASTIVMRNIDPQNQSQSFPAGVLMIDLSSTQRIKLVEAMVFIIRRRGPAIQTYSSFILDAMLYGRVTDQNHSEVGRQDYCISPFERQKLIQEQTDVCFRPRSLSDDNNEELATRVSVGGPVFKIEENDLLRAALISIVSEILSVVHPSSSSSRCTELVRLGVESLRLDESRQ